MKRLYLFLLFAALQTSLASAESRSVYGTVRDKQTGEQLVGANVTIAGTTLGTVTDLDGKYTLRGTIADTATIRVSMVGYAPTVITQVLLAGRTSLKLDVDLQSTDVTTEEIVVTAQRQIATESALLAVRKSASTISDGFSNEQIKRTPDVTSADALRRVTGLSIVDNKFVYIRGITDRYNGTSLDGASVATTEAGKKSFSFDQIPANLLENTTVIKSATPDLPGDFTGGMVQMSTLDFPDRPTYRIAVGGAYNTNTTGQSFSTSQGGSRDWLGMDDGSRKFPGYPPGKEIYMGADLTELAAELPNNFAPRSRTASPNGNLALSVGNKLLLGDETGQGSQLGYIAALSYRAGLQRTEHDVNDLDLARTYSGVNDDRAVLWGAIANLSYKFWGLNKISFKNNFNQSATDRMSLSTGYDSPLDADLRIMYSDWTQRSVYTGQFTGEHELPSFNDLSLKWHVSVSSSRREDPDEKRVVSQRQHGTEDAFAYSNNQRSWSELNDRTWNYGADFSMPLGPMKLKAGGLYELRTTDYQIAYLNIVPSYGTPSYYYTLPIDQVYAPENFGAGKWNLQSGSVATDHYDGEQTIKALYAMADFPFELLAQRFRLTGGVRNENFSQEIRIPRTLGDNPVYATSTLARNDLLPSLNLTYMFNEQANLRFAYSHSVNRPEFRERSLTSYFDYVRYELVGGDTSLQRAYIHNYDVRLEFFPGPGEVLAVSYFRKVISNAIEEQLGFASTRERKPFNSPHASNSGWEVELRKSFGFLGGYFANFALIGNYTRVQSSVEYVAVTQTGYVPASRPMQGQSPYVINLSIQYTEPSIGTTFSVAYNRFGERLDAVGFQTADIYESPRDLVDLSLTQQFLGNWEGKFAVRNLTNKDRILTRQGILYDRSGFGTSYSLQLSLAL
jgi:hypothetical protein